jgi:hypothetical protein
MTARTPVLILPGQVWSMANNFGGRMRVKVLKVGHRVATISYPDGREVVTSIPFRRMARLELNPDGSKVK